LSRSFLTAAVVATQVSAAFGAQAPRPGPANVGGTTTVTQPGGQTPVTLPTVRLGATFTGDLDGMVKRRSIRVIVPYSKTSYFIDKGVQRGVAYDFFKLFEDYVNTKLKTGNLRVHVVFIPTSREELANALFGGKGDIAAGNITITEARRALADFSEPIGDHVREIVVTGPGAPAVDTLADLAGQTLHVRKGSIYQHNIEAVSEQLVKDGRKPITIKELPANLEDEDILEMVNAGLIEMTVVDEHIARFWKQIFTKITVDNDVIVKSDLVVGYVMRKNSPQLKAMLDGFVKTHRAGTAAGNVLLTKYLRSTKFVKSATSPQELEKFEQLISVFRKYGEQYGVDWMLMAAQGYQESGLNQSAKSAVGAIGVMQVMPETGKDMKVGNIQQMEPNINAGIKYIRFMIDTFYQGEQMDELNKALFAFAAYNAGPGRVKQLRQEARRTGLDPNVWFNNVERIASKRIGRETVTYVSNIYKYYIAYKLSIEELQERKKTS